MEGKFILAVDRARRTMRIRFLPRSNTINTEDLVQLYDLISDFMRSFGGAATKDKILHWDCVHGNMPPVYAIAGSLDHMRRMRPILEAHLHHSDVKLCTQTSRALLRGVLLLYTPVAPVHVEVAARE